MSTVVFPNTMFDVRAWLRAAPNLAPIHGGRVFFRLPDTVQTPCMRIYRAGGAVMTNSEAPVQDIRLSIEIWGSAWKDYPVLTNLQLALEDLCHNVQGGTLINPSGNTVLHNASFNVGFDSPDPETGWPRIVCDVVVTVTAKTPTVI